ncbi:double-stranded RNA-specific editase Adar-like [Tribolium madens]|uniref:double-stranded RNA-specific editase Adar-like n=1 Tax=Tribolium madens TaxID=41895 RepID=UPI001CF7221C|nr:double-stranded RNA-specific editase Adar-like [Tribolium madens]XP_044252634.1 double-stranded RNA-specific editase Adar-like [Tribolium madens]XP_044252635.1 double-stranded RNA-specific editase Adar-like [Tribolium madens]
MSEANEIKLKEELENVQVDLKNRQICANYLKSFLKYTLVQDAPFFKMAVKVNDKVYYGEGESKTKARNDVTENVLKSLTGQSKDSDFSKAVFFLNKLYPNAVYTCTELTNVVPSQFKVTIRVGEEKFTAIDPSKKKAKKAATFSALTGLQNSPKPEIGVSGKADFLRKIVEDKIEKLLVNDSEHWKRKVTSGIVMTRKGNVLDYCVIAVATGTRCISGKNLSYSGANLNDMHAEILSRRCLIKYFYDELEHCLEGKDSIFMQNGRKFTLKDGIEFHLYVNTTPCGDARVFSPDIGNTSPKKNYGLLRTKIEAGEGTHPTKNKTFAIQTVEKISQGQRLLTMSCSDKICRWNVLGLQGGLLANFLEPIYLQSIILGNVIHESHLQRALYGRIKDTLQTLPSRYRLNIPSMFFLPSTDPKVTNGPSFAITWSRYDRSYEIINTRTGQTDLGPSRFSKQELFKRFVNLSEKIWGQSQQILYIKAKYADLEYNTAKKILNEAFENAGLGNWISKPVKQDMFTL